MENITYSTEAKEIDNLEVTGFFEGWQSKPSDEALRSSIKNATYVVLAIDTTNNKLVGYITALSDRVFAAYIPFLEVLSSYRFHGIGHTLVEKMTAQLNHLYMIDLVCDEEKASFYAEAGFQSWHAMIKRNFENQRGAFS